MTDRPLLTIAIPTYNRPAALRELYDDFFSKLPAHVFAKVECIVSDNSDVEISNSNAEFFENTPISHFSNEGNQGYARNIVNCVRRASGKYLWITSDDDHIFPERFSSFVDWLTDRSNEPHSVFLPYLARGIEGTSNVVSSHDNWKVGRTTCLRELVDESVNVPFILPSSCVLNLQGFDSARLEEIDIEFANNDFIQVPLFQEIVGNDDIVFYDDYVLRYQLPIAVRFRFRDMVSSMRRAIAHLDDAYPGAERKLTVRDNKRWMGWLLWHRAGVVDVAGADDTDSIDPRAFLRPFSLVNSVLYVALRMPRALIKGLLATRVFYNSLGKNWQSSVRSYKRRVADVSAFAEARQSTQPCPRRTGTTDG